MSVLGRRSANEARSHQRRPAGRARTGARRDGTGRDWTSRERGGTRRGEQPDVERLPLVLNCRRKRTRCVLFCCFIYCFFLFSALFFFSGGRGGTGQRQAGRAWDEAGRSTGRDGVWRDRTLGGRSVTEGLVRRGT